MIAILREIYNLAVRIIIKAIAVVPRLFSKGHSIMAGVMLPVCKAMETKTEFVSFQTKTKDTVGIPNIGGLKQSHDLAIVLQGPVCTKDDTTANSILFYQKTYPDAKIIVSTWDDEPEAILTKLSALGAYVVTSAKPSNAGVSNINMQLVNSLAGANEAKNLGCEFAVKTRTDQRICRPYVFDVMLSMVKLFSGHGNQKGRIVALGYPNAGMFVPYYICDYLYLGYTEDLVSLFSAPMDERYDSQRLRDSVGFLSRREVSRSMIPPEIYIMKHYIIDILKLDGKETIEDYWQVVKDYFVCFGLKDVDLLWDKYNLLYDSNYFYMSYGGPFDSSSRLHTMCFDFFNWFNLYVGNIKYDKKYEQYADVSFWPNVYLK